MSRNTFRLAPLVPLAVSAVYGVVLIAGLPRLLRGAFLNSDVASIPVLTSEVASRGAGVAVVSIATYYSSFLFNLATQGLSFHREVWEALSIGLSLAGVGMLAWSVRRVAGRAAGILTLTFGIAVSPIVLMEFLWFRGPTWFTGALLSFYIIVLTRRQTSSSPVVTVGAPIAVGAVLGLNLVSDPLLAISGLLPFVAAAGSALLVMSPESKAGLLKAFGLVSIAAFIAASLTNFGMRAMGFRVKASPPGGPLRFSSPAELRSKINLFAEDIAAFGNGQFLGQAASPAAVGRLIAAVAAFAALAVPFVLLRSHLKDRAGLSSNPSRFVFVVFWATSALVVSAAFIFSSVPAEGPHSSRYLIPVYFAMVATVGMWARPGLRRLVVAAAGAVICAISLGGLFNFIKAHEGNQLHRQGSKLIEVLHRESLTKGYSAYLHSLGLTWLTDMQVGVHPVYDCGKASSPQLCAFPINTMTGWYRPSVNQRTFLLIGEPGPFELRAPPSALGPPLKVVKAANFSVYIYDYNIAARFVPLGRGPNKVSPRYAVKHNDGESRPAGTPCCGRLAS